MPRAPLPYITCVVVVWVIRSTTTHIKDDRTFILTKSKSSPIISIPRITSHFCAYFLYFLFLNASDVTKQGCCSECRQLCVLVANQGPYRRELNTVTLITKNRLTQRSYSDLICFISVIYFLPQPEQTISLPSAFLIFSLYKVVGVIFIRVWFLSVETSLMFQWRRLNIQCSIDPWLTSESYRSYLKNYLLCLLQGH